MKSDSIKLAIAMPAFYEQIIGGSEYQAYLLAEMAKATGMDVHYIFVDNGIPCNNNLGICLHPLKRQHYSKRLGAIWSLYYVAVSRQLKSLCPDIVYVRGGYSWAGMTARFARNNNCRSVWHVASSKDVTSARFSYLMKRPFDLIEKLFIEYAIRHSTHVVSHARFLDDLLMRHYGRSSEIILKEQPLPTESLTKRNVLTVVWIANIKPLKQPEMFINLARKFVGHKNLEFIMIGRPATGLYQKELDSGINALPNIRYLGEQPIQRVNEILAESHIFINTSTYEGLPNTFVQSWMREVPVVSMLLDPDDILRTQNIGFLSGSFDQMIKDVGMLIADETLRNDMGKRAREYALKNHSLERNMKKLFDLLLS